MVTRQLLCSPNHEILLGHTLIVIENFNLSLEATRRYIFLSSVAVQRQRIKIVCSSFLRGVGGQNYSGVMDILFFCLSLETSDEFCPFRPVGNVYTFWVVKLENDSATLWAEISNAAK